MASRLTDEQGMAREDGGSRAVGVAEDLAAQLERMTAERDEYRGLLIQQNSYIAVLEHRLHGGPGDAGTAAGAGAVSEDGK